MIAGQLLLVTPKCGVPTKAKGYGKNRTYRINTWGAGFLSVRQTLTPENTEIKDVNSFVVGL